MQIGIDLGATKIEYVLLDNNNKELEINRYETPKDFGKTIIVITDIIEKLQKKYNSKFVVGICHPGNLDSSSGLIKNAHNSIWLNNKSLIKELKKIIDNDVFSENDANCFSLSEAFDGAARHYNSVFGIILGSGCGGGLVINKKIVSGANGLGGEWSLNQMPLKEINSNIDYNGKFDFSQRIENIPETLKTLALGHNSIRRIENLPRSVRHLELENNRIEEFPISLMERRLLSFRYVGNPIGDIPYIMYILKL